MIRQTTAHVDLEALAGNLRSIQHWLQEQRPAAPPEVIAVVKANAYGHGAPQVARALEAAEGNRTKAAELLGISVRTLRNKLNTPEKDD